MPVFSNPERQRLEDHCKFDTNLVSAQQILVKPRLHTAYQNPVSKQTDEEMA